MSGMLSMGTAGVFQRNIRSLALSTPITTSITLRQSTGPIATDFASGQVIYPETATPLNAFRGIVTEKQATERIQAGTTWWAINPDEVTGAIKIGDRISDDAEVVWFIYEIGDPDPTDSLIRVYTRRSSANGN